MAKRKTVEVIVEEEVSTDKSQTEVFYVGRAHACRMKGAVSGKVYIWTREDAKVPVGLLVDNEDVESLLAYEAPICSCHPVTGVCEKHLFSLSA